MDADRGSVAPSDGEQRTPRSGTFQRLRLALGHSRVDRAGPAAHLAARRPRLAGDRPGRDAVHRHAAARAPRPACLAAADDGHRAGVPLDAALRSDRTAGRLCAFAAAFPRTWPRAVRCHGAAGAAGGRGRAGVPPAPRQRGLGERGGRPRRGRAVRCHPHARSGAARPRVLRRRDLRTRGRARMGAHRPPRRGGRPRAGCESRPRVPLRDAAAAPPGVPARRRAGLHLRVHLVRDRAAAGHSADAHAGGHDLPRRGRGGLPLVRRRALRRAAGGGSDRAGLG